MRPEDTQEQLKSLFQEAKAYYGLQKDYLKLTMVEQLTLVIGKIVIAVTVGLLLLFVILLLGLALVHWIGSLLGNIAICYAGFALFLVLAAFLFYVNRRKLVILPLARMFSQAILGTGAPKMTEENAEEPKGN